MSQAPVLADFIGSKAYFITMVGLLVVVLVIYFVIKKRSG